MNLPLPCKLLITQGNTIEFETFKSSTGQQQALVPNSPSITTKTFTWVVNTLDDKAVLETFLDTIGTWESFSYNSLKYIGTAAYSLKRQGNLFTFELQTRVIQ